MTNEYKRPSVLIVEDEGIIAQNLQEMLRGLGYDAFATAASSEQALAAASERCPDVVLMDIRIKGDLDGITTAELLRERFDVPVIYLTAHADDATLERAKKTEPYGYLMKPIKSVELQSTIEIAWHKSAVERRLRERERWLSMTLRSIGDAVLMVDLAGKITFMNPAAESLLGVTLKEALGRSAREVMPLSGDEWRLETPLDRALHDRRLVQVSEAVLEAGSGSTRIIEDSAAPVIDREQMLGAVMVFRDVTEQRLLQQQLEVADRLASLGTMAAGVAHEINNPLAVVVGNAEFVLEHLRTMSREPGAAARKREMEELIDAQRDILSAASRISHIVSDLKAFSRPGGAPSGAMDVRSAIEWAVRSTAQEFRHRARLTTRLENVPPVDGEETRLGQVLVNLLVNAAQAIAPGDAANNEVCVTARTDPGGRVVIEVSDTGGGMPADVLKQIFVPFFTTKPVGVGTGLGLSICHGIVASMGGELSVESAVGKGTTFRVVLRASDARKPAPAPLPLPVGLERRGRLLIIDDEDLVIKALRRILEEHEIVSTGDAREALARLEHDDGFDIIFCDLMMPSMTGMEFYEALLRRAPRLARRVIFVSGGAMTSAVASFLDTVPNQRIQKPFGADNLRATVQKLLLQEPRA
jgi:PAS domain S-box-containing protein